MILNFTKSNNALIIIKIKTENDYKDLKLAKIETLKYEEKELQTSRL